jgi:hypothetical protein
MTKTTFTICLCLLGVASAAQQNLTANSGNEIVREGKTLL